MHRICRFNSKQFIVILYLYRCIKYFFDCITSRRNIFIGSINFLVNTFHNTNIMTSSLGIIVHLLAILVSSSRAIQVRYQIYQGYKFKVIANTPATLLVSYSVLHEAACLALCKSELCTAVAFNKDSKTCTVNKYGRIILELDSGSSAWIKRMYGFYSNL